MSLYAQHGYGKAAKIDKAINSNDISGVIISPKAESPDKVLAFTEDLEQNYPHIRILFDPQFHAFNLQGEINPGKLIQYPYYRNNLTRAHLSVPSNIKKFTEDVLNFQRSIIVDDLISPTISFDDFNARESQIAISLAYESIEATDAENELLVSLCINENAFTNKSAMDDFLNVISLLDVKGFYIIVERTSTEKLTFIKDNILTNIIRFIYVLSTLNNYDVVMGYSDMLSIPLAIAGDIQFSCGWHNNLKGFSSSIFRPSTGGRRPRKRYTSAKLLNSILLVPELATLNRMKIGPEILSNSPFDSLVYPVINDTAWTDEVICLHNWYVINKLLTEIEQEDSISGKIDLVINKIEVAQNYYRIINERIPSLDTKSNNSHLNYWLSAIKDFRKQIGM